VWPGLWRAAFPAATAANHSREWYGPPSTLSDADFVHFRGVRELDMRCCWQTAITDSAFAHLAGIHTLNMSYCSQDTITDGAFAHLAGIHTLSMRYCYQITDGAFAHLAGIHTLNMSWCRQATITDGAFVHLAGIHTLNMGGCNRPPSPTVRLRAWRASASFSSLAAPNSRTPRLRTWLGPTCAVRGSGRGHSCSATILLGTAAVCPRPQPGGGVEGACAVLSMWPHWPPQTVPSALPTAARLAR
jgi:hypothetical protein